MLKPLDRRVVGCREGDHSEVRNKVQSSAACSSRSLIEGGRPSAHSRPRELRHVDSRKAAKGKEMSMKCG